MSNSDKMNRWCAAGTLVAFMAPVAPLAVFPVVVFCFWKGWRYSR